MRQFKIIVKISRPEIHIYFYFFFFFQSASNAIPKISTLIENSFEIFIPFTFFIYYFFKTVIFHIIYLIEMNILKEILMTENIFFNYIYEKEFP